MPEWLVVGRIVAAFGTKGEIRVFSHTDFPQRFEEGARLWVEREASPRVIDQSRTHKGQYILKLQGVDDRDAAEALQNRYLQVPGTDLAPLEEGEYYLLQIIGLNVETEEGRQLGPVAEVLQTGANDVYVVKTDRGELLLPAIHEVIRQVDLPSGKIIVHLLPGLMPDEVEET